MVGDPNIKWAFQGAQVFGGKRVEATPQPGGIKGKARAFLLTDLLTK